MFLYSCVDLPRAHGAHELKWSGTYNFMFLEERKDTSTDCYLAYFSRKASYPYEKRKTLIIPFSQTTLMTSATDAL